ncbi:MAG TPA: hypothetical protein VGJ91_07220, partial [Polyangiaceae bacterium]
MHLSARPAAVIAGLTLAVSACFTPATAAAKAPTLFTDEFTGPTLDSSAWALLNRPGGEDGLEYYAPANATITNGALNVLTKVDGAFSCCRHSSAELQWRSAGFTYGTVEVRARLAGGQGTWPAIWLLGQGCQVSNLTTPANVG